MSYASALSHTDDRAVEDLRAQVETITRKIDDLEQTSDVSVSLASGSTTFAHKLGRQPVGWEIIDITCAAIVYRESWSSTQITLNASASATAKVRVW